MSKHTAYGTTIWTEGTPGKDALCLGTAYGGEHWITDYACGDHAFPLFGPDPEGRPAEANARLWAAAGQMLEALEAIKRALTHPSIRIEAKDFADIAFADASSKVDAAINKATGP